MRMSKLFLTATATAALAICPLMAQSPDTILTYAVTGTLGPVLQGSDPMNINGDTGTLTVKVNSNLTPTISNATFAAYILPVGAVTAQIGSQPFTTTRPSKMTIQLGGTGDLLNVIFWSQDNTGTRFTAQLAAGSFGPAALMHPTLFRPTPQNLTPATKSGGAGSELFYTDQGALTVLGLTGSASCSSAAAPPVPVIGPGEQ